MEKMPETGGDALISFPDYVISSPDEIISSSDDVELVRAEAEPSLPNFDLGNRRILKSSSQKQKILENLTDMLANLPSREGLIINEWYATSGFRSKQPGTSVSSQTRRRIDKVPQTLRLINRKEYDPVVVSFGPYHHGKEELRLAEEFKLTCLQIYASRCDGKSMHDLQMKVLEVIDDVRDCYVEGSTEMFDDEKFTNMMLLDGCLLLLLMESMASGSLEWIIILVYKYLGGVGHKKIYRDMILLENQLPFEVLHVLMTVRFDKKEDQKKEILDTLHNFFFYYLNEILGSEKLKNTIIDQYDKLHQPLHLLQIFRECFLIQVGIGNSNKKEDNSAYNENNVKEYALSFGSVTEIKAKGIFFRPCKSQTGLNFKSYYLYGKLEIPPMRIGRGTKSKLLNLIAYELCLSNPNDFKVTSYVRFMKMLIQHADDVKELRTKNILRNFMGKDDEDVVTMFEDIIAPPINSFTLRKVEQKIQKHCNSKVSAWIAELFANYFSSPWKAVAFLAATVLLVSTLAQTYFTIYPHK